MPNVVKELCKHKADVNIASKTTGRNILHMAIAAGSLDLVKFLLENTNISLEAKDFQDYTCLTMSEALLADYKPEMIEINKAIISCLVNINDLHKKIYITY